MTFGEKAVDLYPGDDEPVAQSKTGFAALIDQMHALRLAAGPGEQARLASVAITELQTAQMWATKALTWKDGE